jgi:hypothetical protein
MKFVSVLIVFKSINMRSQSVCKDTGDQEQALALIYM